MNEQLTHEDNTFEAKSFPIILLSETVLQPANTGSLFRLADAFGVKKIYLPEGINLNSNRLKRTARATIKSVEHSFFYSIEEILTHYKQVGYKIYCLEITQESIAIERIQLQTESKILLVVGNENFGISSATLKLADACIHITMFGQNSSMNIAQATGIALFEITKKLSQIKKK